MSTLLQKVLNPPLHSKELLYHGSVKVRSSLKSRSVSLKSSKSDSFLIIVGSHSLPPLVLGSMLIFGNAWKAALVFPTPVLPTRTIVRLLLVLGPGSGLVSSSAAFSNPLWYLM